MNIVDDKNNGKPASPQSGVTAEMLKEAEDVKCEKCQCEVFEEKMIIKKVSKFLTGSTQDSIAPMPIIACANCNNINEIFKPNI